ncbi:hypothetical protein [Haloarcula sp. JP-L23]|uniref:hypothetical protein n=1 Tax=Haloarcula sp. JP-L23 TaxID=2716717 RepID=UPI001D04B7FA
MVAVERGRRRVVPPDDRVGLDGPTVPKRRVVWRTRGDTGVADCRTDVRFERGVGVRSLGGQREPSRRGDVGDLPARPVASVAAASGSRRARSASRWSSGATRVAKRPAATSSAAAPSR